MRTVACQGMTGVTGSPTSQPATWQTVFTSMFMHGSFLHIFGNMVFLVIFGPNVEDATGRMRYLAFYLLGGIVALGAQVLVSPGSTAPTLGASGAIAAVLGGYLLLYPRARVLTLVVIVFFATIVEVPAVLLLAFWFLQNLVIGATGLASPIGGGGVAYFAHIGGFVFGLAAIRVFVSRKRGARQRAADAAQGCVLSRCGATSCSAQCSSSSPALRCSPSPRSSNRASRSPACCPS